MIALPKTSFDKPLPFKATNSTALLMESLDYDWELLAMSTQAHRILASKMDALTKTQEIAKLVKRREEIAERRAEISKLIERDRSQAKTAKPIARKVIVALLLAGALAGWLFAGCSEQPTAPETPDLYAVITEPGWPASHIIGEYECMKAGAGWRITNDTLVYVSPPNTETHIIQCRIQGNEVWFVAGPWRFRGVYSPTIAGHITEKTNGRYGPIQSITFQRVR